MFYIYRTMENHHHCRDIEYAIKAMDSYSFTVGGTVVTVRGDRDGKMYHAEIWLDTWPWVGISCGHAGNLARKVMEEALAVIAEKP